MLQRKNEELKIYEIWLTNADQNDESTMASIEPVIKEWHSKGYMPVIYRSGHDDLYDCTLSLLRHNRKVSARREMELER